VVGAPHPSRPARHRRTRTRTARRAARWSAPFARSAGHGSRVGARRQHRRRRGRKGHDAGTPTGLLVTLQPPEAQGTRYEVADECTVGRGAGCQVHLDDTFTSQLHARIFRRDGRLAIEDLASTNGTFVNGARITDTVALRAGDQVQIGQTVLEVR
jgi:pSer/pThr/pTyr-binding forkhead associated (FHA) protein